MWNSRNFPRGCWGGTTMHVRTVNILHSRDFISRWSLSLTSSVMSFSRNEYVRKYILSFIPFFPLAFSSSNVSNFADNVTKECSLQLRNIIREAHKSWYMCIYVYIYTRASLSRDILCKHDAEGPLTRVFPLAEWFRSDAGSRNLTISTRGRGEEKLHLCRVVKNSRDLEYIFFFLVDEL